MNNLFFFPTQQIDQTELMLESDLYLYYAGNVDISIIFFICILQFATTFATLV